MKLILTIIELKYLREALYSQLEITREMLEEVVQTVDNREEVARFIEEIDTLQDILDKLP